MPEDTRRDRGHRTLNGSSRLTNTDQPSDRTVREISIEPKFFPPTLASIASDLHGRAGQEFHSHPSAERNTRLQEPVPSSVPTWISTRLLLLSLVCSLDSSHHVRHKTIHQGSRVKRPSLLHHFGKEVLRRYHQEPADRLVTRLVGCQALGSS